MPGLFKRRKSKRVLVLGLDCAGPQLVFDQFRDKLPTLGKLIESGTWGELESCIPCITVPAWASMLSSRDPGVLGCYGFRNRADYSYARMVMANSATIKVKRVWDYLSDAGKQSILIGVPQTYPPLPVNGLMVGDFLAPGIESAFTYPAIFKQEVLQVAPNYQFDVKNFRTEDKKALLQRLIDTAEIQHRLVKYCLKTRPWDFFMYVNMGIDRIHHGFWRFHDSQHRLYEAGSAFATAIEDFYRLVDRMVGELIQLADEATVLVVSDHGVTRMDGGICLNEWLWRNGWLALKSVPSSDRITPFEEADIDWTSTRAWGSGGYYGRVWLNVTGREPQGIIPASDYERVRDELASALEAITGPANEVLHTRVFKPQAIYQEVNGVAPDLIVYFGDLHWRSVGSFGHGRHYTFENDTGPDDANHATHGLFILYEPGKRGAGHVTGHHLMDIAPTLLDRMSLKIPLEMQGKAVSVRP